MDILPHVITAVAAVLASSGFWAYFTKKADRQSASTKLLLGLAHERIVDLGLQYIRRGYIHKDEYQDFMRYLYDPYNEFGGNGLANRVVIDLKNLPLYKDHTTEREQVELRIEQRSVRQD